MVDSQGPNLRGCLHCGLVQRVPAVPTGQEALCARCGGTVLRSGQAGDNRRCAALALSALICYPVGIALPIMHLEKLGHVHEASIWTGILTLLTQGQWVVGLVVLVCSMIIPVFKLLGLFVLTVNPATLQRRHQAHLFRWIERAGRWGMIDVLLLAVLVAALKLGDLVTVTPGPGAVAFTSCVVLSVLASACFRPQVIWEAS